jgi:hypothetical protein
MYTLVGAPPTEVPRSVNVCVNVNVNTTDATTGATALLLNVCLCDTNTQHVNSTRNETHADGELRNSKEKRESGDNPYIYELGRESARRHGR